MRNLKISVGHIRRLFAAMVLCLLVAHLGNANASAPLPQSWGVNGAAPFFPTMNAACLHSLIAWPGWTFSKAELKQGSTTSAWCYAKDATREVALTSVSLVANPICANGSAPNTSLPLAQQCTEPSNCPTAGTSAGITNITTAWANGSSVGASIQQKIIPDGGLANANAVNYCVSSCGISNSGAAPTACWQSSIASGTGLYRISCDVPMVSTGQPCTVGTGAGQSPDPTIPPPAPACAGAFGTVNGKPTCLDSSGSTPNNTTPTPNPGNPAPGTVGGGDKSTGVDSGTGAGTGTDGTGTGGAGGGGGGGGTNVTVEVKDIATCGLPGKPKCLMDETGTPDGKGAETQITDAQIKTLTDGREAEMKKKQDSWGLSWNFQLPQGACEPLDLTYAGKGRVFDWCPMLSKLRSVIGYFYVMLTLLGIYASYSNAVKFNKG